MIKYESIGEALKVNYAETIQAALGEKTVLRAFIKRSDLKRMYAGACKGEFKSWRKRLARHRKKKRENERV